MDVHRRLIAAAAATALVTFLPLDSEAFARAARLNPTEEAAAFTAAGFTPTGRQWVRCNDAVTPSRQGGRIKVVDLNDDGTPEAWVTEASTLCYGNTATAFVLVTKKGRDWVVLLDSVGLPLPLESKTRGWADITVGLPGVGPVPVYRFNGSKYVRVP